MKVVIAATARGDLAEIGDYIAKESPERALAFVNAIRAALLRLGDAPRAYPVVPRYGDAGVRRRSFRGYLIFYRVDPAAVTVLRVLHGARDYERLLFPDT